MFLPQKLYGVIGDPIGHSLSPVLHNAAFQAWGIPAVLLPWRIAAERLADFVAAARLLPVAGACVTIPHKEKMLSLVDRATPLARAVGAVNTLYRDGDELVGHNTDVEGFLQPLYQRGEFPTALILGAGGAARAVLAGLLSLDGVRRVLVTARREEQARALAGEVRALPDEHAAPRTPPAVEIGPWNARHDVTADLVINTTPVGMSGGKAAFASPFTEFRGRGLAYDLIYQATPFLKAARAAGWETLNGRDMFVAQASAQFILWTGFPLPDTALAALDEAITRRSAEQAAYPTPSMQGASHA